MVKIITCAVEPAVCARTHCNYFTTFNLFLSSLRILGYQRWGMWNGSCRQLKSWMVCCSGHTVPQETAFHQGRSVQSILSHMTCVCAAVRGMTLHCTASTFQLRSLSVLCLRVPLVLNRHWEYMTVPRILFSGLYSFLWPVSFSSHAWDGRFFLNSFFERFPSFFWSAFKAKRCKQAFPDSKLFFRVIWTTQNEQILKREKKKHPKYIVDLY